MSLEIVQAEVSKYMDEILGMFKPGAKITVAVRRPDLPEQDFLMTNDDPAEVIALVQRRQAAESAA